jgi:glycosyltransferase involved in cell wall biosynthesis
MEWQGRFKKNIGLFFTETQLDYDHPWISKIKLMDELWLPTVDMDYLTFDNINSYIVPVPTDPKKYDNVNPLDLSMLGDTYKFYYIGEYHRRKNISGLVQAFYLQFTRNEPVSLILKCNKPGVDPETLMHEINDMCRKVADALKLYPRFEDYPTIAIITKYISDEEILGLHKTCDCYVNPSFAEGWCVPLSDAFGVGNQVVSNGVGCALDFTEARLTDDAFMVLSHREPVLGMNESASYLYTGREIWKRPNVLLMSDLMGIRYSHDKRDKKPLLPFTTEKVGLMIKERIDDPN